MGEKDDALIPISMLEDGEPTAGTPLRQNMQTNQLLFPYAPTDASPNLILLTTGDGSVKIAAWPPTSPSPPSAPSLQTLHSLHAHTSACLSLALSPTGRYLAVGGSDALVSLWDTQEWVCRRTLSGMQGGVRTVGFSWDGSFVAGGSDEGNGIEIVSCISGEYVLRRIIFALFPSRPPCVARLFTSISYLRGPSLGHRYR